MFLFFCVLNTLLINIIHGKVKSLMTKSRNMTINFKSPEIKYKIKNGTEGVSGYNLRDNNAFPCNFAMMEIKITEFEENEVLQDRLALP